MSARWWIGGVWALAAGSAAYWALLGFVRAPAAPAYTQTAAATPALRGDLARLLGNDPPPPSAATAAEAAEAPADARFQLIGVLSPPSRQAAREGVALIAIDGQPPKAYRVGATVEGQNVLQSVAARSVTLGPRNGPAAVALDLPPPAPATTSTLPQMSLRPPPTPTVPNVVRQVGQPVPDAAVQEDNEHSGEAPNPAVR